MTDTTETTKHVSATGCNLSREDFLPGDPPCADGGASDEHPGGSDQPDPDSWNAETTITVRHEDHDAAWVEANVRGAFQDPQDQGLVGPLAVATRPR